MEYRDVSAVIPVDTGIELREARSRCEISDAKRPLLEAIKAIIMERRSYWPLTVRQVHYILLNDPPLRHANKPNSVYCNDRASYQALDELMVRARLTGELMSEAIDDETRPSEVWSVHRDVQTFVGEQLHDFLRGYRRDMMMSQPNYIEIVAEKLTVQSIVRPIAEKYTIPFVIGRGFANLPLREQMANRFLASGKKNLVVLFLADHDPDGEEIVHSFARSLRDDFGIYHIRAIKCALTADQVTEFNLPSDNLSTAKMTSPNYAHFVQQYGEGAYELEAASPEQLQQALEQAIASVIDQDALDAEVEAEKTDIAFLEKARKEAMKALAPVVARRIRPQFPAPRRGRQRIKQANPGGTWVGPFLLSFRCTAKTQFPRDSDLSEFSLGRATNHRR